MQTLDVRIKLTPRVVRETYGQFERREEEEEEVEEGEGGKMVDLGWRRIEELWDAGQKT